MPYADEAMQREYVKQWKRRTKDWFWEYKKTLACNRCGQNHPATIQFHHVGDKDYEISKMVQRNAPRERILAEIAKCEVVCANCHAIEHYESGYALARAA